jgi:hypothetical protein
MSAPRHPAFAVSPQVGSDGLAQHQQAPAGGEAGALRINRRPKLSRAHIIIKQ